MSLTIAWTNEDGSLDIVGLDVYDEETHTLPAECTQHPVETGGTVTDQVRLGNRLLTIQGYVSNTPLPENDIEGMSFSDKSLQIPATPGYEQKSQKVDVPKGPIKPNVAGLASAGFGALKGALLGGPEALIRKRAADKQHKQTVKVWTLSKQTRSRVAEVFQLLEKAWKNRTRVDVTSDTLGWIPSMILTNVQAPHKPEDGDGSMFVVELEQIRTVSAQTTTAPKPLEPMGQKIKKAGSRAAKKEEDNKAVLRSTLEELRRLAGGS